MYLCGATIAGDFLEAGARQGTFCLRLGSVLQRHQEAVLITVEQPLLAIFVAAV